MKKLSVCFGILIILVLVPDFSFAAQEETAKKKEPFKSAFAQPKFVPDISLIIDFSAVYRELKNEQFEETEIPGFIHSAHEHGDDGHSHESMNANRGFNLNYGELVLAAAVDPYFELFGTFHLSEEGFEIEEAYFSTTRLLFGVQLKAGKFLSAFGRINGQHAHYWDFADNPLVYGAFFGEHNLNEIGAQLSVTLPLPFYLVLGGELLQGKNENSFGAEGFEEKNGQFEVSDADKPNVYVGYLKSSFDVDKLTVLLGASGAFGDTRIDHGVDDAGGHGVKADTYILGGDLTFKYMIDSYRSVALQGEYLYRSMKGDHFDVEAAETTKEDLEKKQSGFYTQLVIRPLIQWRIGARYEQLVKNEVKIDGTDTDKPENLYKISGILEYNPSEFSRIRLQYNYDRARYLEDSKKTNHEVIVQCNMTMGAHGAHTF